VTTTLSRRRVLAAGAVTACAGLAGAQLDTGLAFAADPSYAGDVLVLLSLRGGFDGLSAVVPHGDAGYYAARPGIAVPKTQLIGGDAFFGLHPALAPRPSRRSASRPRTGRTSRPWRSWNGPRRARRCGPAG
jgi:uncharacterized protein (DUF1501 family)